MNTKQLCTGGDILNHDLAVISCWSQFGPSHHLKVATVSKGKSMLRAGEMLKDPDHFVFKFPKTGSHLPRLFLNRTFAIGNFSKYPWEPQSRMGGR